MKAIKGPCWPLTLPLIADVSLHNNPEFCYPVGFTSSAFAKATGLSAPFGTWLTLALVSTLTWRFAPAVVAITLIIFF